MQTDQSMASRQEFRDRLSEKLVNMQSTSSDAHGHKSLLCTSTCTEDGMCRHLLALGKSLVVFSQRSKCLIPATSKVNLRSLPLQSGPLPPYITQQCLISSEVSNQWPYRKQVCRSSSVAMGTSRELPVAEVTVLQGEEDRYEGIIVDGDGLPDDPQEFSERLDYSLRVWQDQQRKGIWITVPISKVGLIEVAVRKGFTFHHAEPNYVQITRWLPSTESKLPANASHQVGVGCFVLNGNNHVLVVQEKNGPLKGKGAWKMVTGLVDAGEDISDAAEREVLEETGVKAKFAAVLALRQAHGFAFGKSDFFFVVALRPEPGQTELVMQEDELEAVAWMPLEEYAAVPFQSSRPILRQILDCCVAYAKGDYLGMTGMKLENGFNDRRDLLIHGEITRKSSL